MIACGFRFGAVMVSDPLANRSQLRSYSRIPAESLAQVLEDFAGGVVAGSARYAVAGVGAVAAEVEVFHRSGVAGPTEQGAHGENLVEG